jgi:S-adenosyl methyltransferase
VERPSWTPEHIDVDRSSIARARESYLGGSDNNTADREFALQPSVATAELTRHAHRSRVRLPHGVRRED